NALYGPLFIRLTVGAYFIIAGMTKLDNPTAFVNEVQKFGILKEPLATLYGLLLPYVEILAGGLLVLGLWTTLAAILSSLMLLSFVIALRVFSDPGSHLFNKDIMVLGATLSLLWSGPGFFSIDYFRKTG
ncbi:MAG: DoxX family protein, partial [Proteobacteria bacterium]|nr:DoxX family protein [Pseudomonadota bacterium]